MVNYRLVANAPLRGRQRWAAATIAALLAATAAGAQTVPDSVPSTPPQARDFRIQSDGTIAPPPANDSVTAPPTTQPAPAPQPVPVPQPAPQPPIAVEPTQQPPVSPETEIPGPEAPAVARRRRARGLPVAPVEASPAPDPAITAPIVDPLVAAPTATPGFGAQPAPAPSPAPIAEAPEESGGFPWWILLLGAIGALALAAFARTRSREPEPEPASADEDLVSEAAEPADIAPAALVADARPRLDIEFKPAAASATDAQAAVEYVLVVTNNGAATAHSVRMEARMFAMGQEHDAALAAFFAEPMARPTPIASSIAPGIHTALRSQVSLPRAEVQPIQVRDRSLFVPLVAFNILYQSGDGETVQTAMSYVVGRETRPPAEKMAPFRLDQGPKIYREVGQRQHRLKQVA